MRCTDAALASLAQQLGQLLRGAGYRVVAAESCTGGWIAKALTDVPGSSDWFERGYVTYSNDAKAEMLGVPPPTLAAHGAVSEPVVRAMAEGALIAARADCAVAVSGIAGPGGATPGKPVGTVWFAWETPARSWTRQALFEGDREAVRRQAVAMALGGLCEALAGSVAR
jgi:nicotinamide-nucleotide amidase